MNDPYETGTPKYSTAQDIYDALREMSYGEEIGILSEMFSDVSWEGQDYYYVDNSGKLFERWEEITDRGDKMWLMDIAVWQLSDEDANEWFYEILNNDDLAKRIGFKKLFVDSVLSGMSSQYKEIAEAFEENLHELDRWNSHTNSLALEAALKTESLPMAWDVIRYKYNDLCSAIYNKLKGLRLDDEKQLIVESRAMLTGYDDFMFGLRANQALYQEQEKMYQNKVALLQARYEDVLKRLLLAAKKQGVVFVLDDSVKVLPETSGAVEIDVFQVGD
jgi:hypothetical protein